MSDKMAGASSATSLALTIDKSFLECSICCGPFVDPRGLPCLHPFCSKCLEDWAKECSEDGTFLSCPLCTKVYLIPKDEGVKGFPAHFLVGYLQNTVDSKQSQISDRDTCSNQEKKEYFCEEHDDFGNCSVLDPIDPWRHSRSLENLTGRVGKVEEKYVNATKKAQQVKQDLERDAAAKIAAIDEARDELLEEVENFVDELKEDVHHKKEVNMCQIQGTLDTLEVELATMRNSCELATNVVQSGSDSDILSLYPSLSSKLQELAQSEPCNVDTTFGTILLEQLNNGTREDLPTLEQLLCEKLHINTASRENSQEDDRTTNHFSAETRVDSLLLPLAATSLSSAAVEYITPTAKRMSATATRVPYYLPQYQQQQYTSQVRCAQPGPVSIASKLERRPATWATVMASHASSASPQPWSTTAQISTNQLHIPVYTQTQEVPPSNTRNVMTMQPTPAFQMSMPATGPSPPRGPRPESGRMSFPNQQYITQPMHHMVRLSTPSGVNNPMTNVAGQFGPVPSLSMMNPSGMNSGQQPRLDYAPNAMTRHASAPQYQQQQPSRPQLSYTQLGPVSITSKQEMGPATMTALHASSVSPQSWSATTQMYSTSQPNMAPQSWSATTQMSTGQPNMQVYTPTQTAEPHPNTQNVMNIQPVNPEVQMSMPASSLPHCD